MISLSHLELLLDRSEPGFWVSAQKFVMSSVSDVASCERDEDAAFIASARASIPALIRIARAAHALMSDGGNRTIDELAAALREVTL